MKRPEITQVAKLLGVPASGTNQELLEKINLKLSQINKQLLPPPKKSGVRVVGGNSNGVRKGFHPITGKPVY